MADQFWANDPVAPAKTQRQPGAPVFIANPGGELDAESKRVGIDTSLSSEERAGRKEGREVSDQQFGRGQQFRTEYEKLPAVQEYRTAVGALSQSLKRAPDATGDVGLIYDYVKALDPTSVVREAEVGMAQSSAPYLEAKAAEIKKQFGIEGGGALPQEVRDRMRREMIHSVSARVKGYNQQRERYSEYARRYSLDPFEVVGNHDADPFVGQFRDYDKRNKLGEYAPRPGGEGGFLPGATPDNVAFDIDTGRGAFGSQLEAGGLSGPQQAALDAFLKANAGNPNFGPDQLGSFYRSIGVDGAVPASPEFFEAVRSGKPFDTTVDTSAADAEIKRRAMEASFAEIPEGADVSSAGRDKGLLLNMTDELRGVVGGVRDTFTGGSFADGYTRERDIERALQERSREENGVLPELIGGLMTPAGMISRTNMARDAAAMGAIAGFGEGEGATDSVAKAVTGGALGGAAGKVVEKAVPAIAKSSFGERVARFLSPKTSDAERRAFVDAADRQNLDYLAADIPGATKTQFATSVAKSTLGGIPLKDAAAKIAEKARAARDRIAGNVGEVGDNAAAGQAAQRGMESWERQSADRGRELYERIPIKPETVVDLSATRAKLQDLNGSISSNADLAALVRDPKMVAYQKALEGGDLSWADIKRFRSYIGEKAGRPALQQDTSKDSLDALYGALSQDIERAAASHSPDAAKAFSRANSYWRGRQTRIDDVMSKLVGKDRNMSPEATFGQIERWAQAKGGDHAALMKAMRSLPDDEASAVRATIIDRLGNAHPGSQGAEGAAFSQDVFLTQWAKLSPRAKAVLFQGEHRQALDDLARVFEGSKFSRGFDNVSKTSIGTNIGALTATGAVSMPTAVAAAAAQWVGGSLLASPKFARWMAGLAKKPNLSAQLAHVDRLTALARSEPVIANDIFTLQQRLADAFAQPSALRSAAEENDDVRKGPPADGERDDAQ